MSKYASLPDIGACSQDTGADVFETPDVPPEISYSLDTDSDDDFRLARAGSPTAALRRARPGAGKQQQQQQDNEAIDAEHLDAVEARKRFGAASRASLNNRNNGRGEDPDERDKETPLERLRRLRLEVTELEEEVRRTELDPQAAAARHVSLETADDEGKDSTASKTKQKKREVSPAVLLQQVQLLRNDLQGISPKVEGVLEADGELAFSPDAAATSGGGRLAQKASATSHLLKKLESAAEEDMPGTAADQPLDVGGAGAAKPEVSPADKNDGVDLEKRVSAMEAILGANEADVDEVHAVPTSLLQTTTRLDHLLTLLAQPRHLDSISRRVKVLVSDLERIHDSRRKLGDTRPLNVALSGGMTLSTLSPEGGAASSTPSLAAAAAAASSAARGDGSTTSLPPDALQKIDALFTLLPRLDPLVPLAPRLVARLRSLANLHASAAQFGESLAELKGQVAELDEGEQGLREVVQGLEKSFEENEARVKGNLEAMDRRVEEVLKRLDRLAA
ncbi:hypothetical protein C6P46_006706 [Rhodotorula mucilaginosa]|uniref:Dynamitin n=1 Tax=Rhodotorula mucilaginosa TaxID=5537 RepID=A0A9P6VY70_RHOMI|nr:hypothetical protein C6P46_006706 [Rhodotorula mucilaginosa]